MADSHVLSLRRLAFAGVFAGLAWGAGYVSIIPNVEFLTLLLFVGGWVVGPRWGALAAALGEALHTVFNPYGSAFAMHPLIGLSQIVGMAASGFAGGVLGRLAPRRGFAAWALVTLAGILVTAWFDLLTNLATAYAFGQWKVTLIAALPFALVHEGSNAALFGTVGALLVRAVEPSRRSLRAPAAAAVVAVALAAIALAGAPPVARAQARATAPARAPVDAKSDSAHAAAHADSTVTPLVTTPIPHPAASADDSVAYRDKVRSAAPPAWGEGPAAITRRDAPSVAALLTREGGFVERWADDRGSAEPLGRFGIASAGGVLVDWLGLPLTGVGAPGGELSRVAIEDVGSYDAPRLPVSAVEPYRGEFGMLTLAPLSSVARHPRVIGWAETGTPEAAHSGFSAGAEARAWDGWLGIAGGSEGPNEPLGATGAHALSTRVAWGKGKARVTGAYRSARSAVEDSLGRAETRTGEGGAVTLALPAAGLAWTARIERTVERTHDSSDLIGEWIDQGDETRGSLSAARAVGATAFTAQATMARQGLSAIGSVNAFGRRAATLGWGSLAAVSPLGARAHASFALGAGTYGNAGVDVAPSALVTLDAAPGRTLWAGAARGLSAAPDPRATDEFGAQLAQSPPPVRSSTWLAGAGATLRSAAESAGGAWRGPSAKGAYRLRAAIYAGRTSPGRDAPRQPFAGEAFEQAPFEIAGVPTTYVAFVATGAWAPMRGFTVDAGGQGIGRSVDPVIVTGDPEARAHLTLEARRILINGALDARLAVTGEWIGPRLATASGDLPAATRLGFVAHAIVDEFELRFALDNAFGSNRTLPVPDPSTGDPVPATQRAFRAQVRWTFWD